MNHYYSASIKDFLHQPTDQILGQITLSNQFDGTINQNHSWVIQIELLKTVLSSYQGNIYFEFSIPRMGKRVDVLVIIESIVFVIEFKVGEHKFHKYDIEQVWDYTLDLKNFHEPSHTALLVPLLVATDANIQPITIFNSLSNDGVLHPICLNAEGLGKAIRDIVSLYKEGERIDGVLYGAGRYSPTPTIIEAAVSLYNSHSVEAITRNDAAGINLKKTSEALNAIIDEARTGSKKIICFVTGVPGAGKTLVGLNVATSQLEITKGANSVYLSGNGPLVAVLQEALARDKVIREKQKGNRQTLKEARSGVKAFIQIIHHYRDAYLRDKTAPVDHVAIFDEAQRAWTKEQTVKFMKRRKGLHDFKYSEPEFLISCLDRHKDWAVVICLVGGGQEINTGEAGISEWLHAVQTMFKEWEVYISPNLRENEYAAKSAINTLASVCKVYWQSDLHLAVSMRSFRAENLSNFITQLLDRDEENAVATFKSISASYPIVLTRNVSRGKKWLKDMARGSERYGLVVSSQAYRLKPHAIDVKSPMNPVNWFLNDRNDVRSSYYLEDVATEFQIQGLELDWTCVIWDGDLRYSESGWQTFSFKGLKWQRVKKEERIKYLINAYRVLLTRARQGMVIVVPEGDSNDHTRKPAYYDTTYAYLKRLGITSID